MKMTMKEGDVREEMAVLESLAPYRGNLVLAFLLDRLHLGVSGVIVAAFVTLSLLNILLNALQGTLWPTPKLPNALFSVKWVAHWTSIPFLYPIAAGVAVVVYKQIPSMFRNLISSGVLVTPRDQRSFFTNLQRHYQSRVVNLVLIIGLIIIVIGWTIVKLRQNFSDWNHVDPGVLTVASWYWIFIGTVGIYVVLHLSFTILVTFRAMRTVFADKSRFAIALKFMHPDRICGLRPMSKFVLWIGFLLALLGFMNGVYIVSAFYRLGSVWELLQSIGPILLVVGYVLLAPLLFFLPLLPAHNVMLKAKDKFQLQISRELDYHLQHMSFCIEQGKFDVAEHSHIEVLSSYKRYMDALPVWPFDIGTIAKFFSMVLLPLMLSVLGILFQKLFL